jgi:hypothetical protein
MIFNYEKNSFLPFAKHFKDKSILLYKKYNWVFQSIFNQFLKHNHVLRGLVTDNFCNFFHSWPPVKPSFCRLAELDVEKLRNVYSHSIRQICSNTWASLEWLANVPKQIFLCIKWSGLPSTNPSKWTNSPNWTISLNSKKSKYWKKLAKNQAPNT